MIGLPVFIIGVACAIIAAWLRFGPRDSFFGYTADRYLFAALFIGGVGVMLMGGGV